MSRRSRMVVAVSGPDGSGKSSLVRRLADGLAADGFSVATAYCYGCVVCRRSSDRAAGRSRSRPDRRAWISRCHASVDAAELMIRLMAAWWRARLRPGRRPVAVVTDRGPLDGLAKFGPAPGSLGAALFASASRRYDVVLLLDAPANVLAARDGEHCRRELDEWRRRYRAWARFVPGVVQLEIRDLEPAAVAAEAARAVSARVRSAGQARKHVVISSYDGPRNPHYLGGGAVVVNMVASALAAEFQVTVVTGGHRSGAARCGGVRYQYLPVCWAGPRLGQLLFHALLPTAARRIPHDLWIESFTPPFSTSLVPLFSPARVVALAQNLSGQEMQRRYHLPFVLIERLGLRCYSDVVVLNPVDSAAIKRHNPSATVRVIPNCIELPRVDEQSLGHGEHIFYIGRIEIWAKGLDLLLAAYERSQVTMPLLIAGAGIRCEERKLTSLLAATRGEVRWLGHVAGQRKAELLERSAFVVLPSRHETFGISALEAMAYGKPVLHFDLPALRWMEGDVRLPMFDTAALGRSIRELAHDERNRRDLGRCARAAARHYRPEQMKRHYLALVRQQLEPKAARLRGGAA
jgi:glycosyltransferase involved in cell wall biosynthesis